ncbi:MAG: hypothetical protein ABIH11_06270 [Candidatus Altiarchaeota archaeon]
MVHKSVDHEAVLADQIRMGRSALRRKKGLDPRVTETDQELLDDYLQAKFRSPDSKKSEHAMHEEEFIRDRLKRQRLK